MRVGEEASSHGAAEKGAGRHAGSPDGARKHVAVRQVLCRNVFPPTNTHRCTSLCWYLPLRLVCRGVVVVRSVRRLANLDSPSRRQCRSRRRALAHSSRLRCAAANKPAIQWIGRLSWGWGHDRHWLLERADECELVIRNVKGSWCHVRM